MPRVARKKSSSEGLYHIIERGNERKDIFHDDEDRLRFLEIVKRNQIKYGFEVYTYCLMTNHLHLLLVCHGTDISQVMKSINVSYAMYFNRKYQRCGHLFQDRFKSEMVDTDAYAIEVSRYIHLNPVRAGIVSCDGILEFNWSSYRQYVHSDAGGSLPVNTAFILGLFSDSPVVGREKYEEYVMRDEEAGDYKARGGCSMECYGVDAGVSEKPMSKLEQQELLQGMASDPSIDWETIREKRSSEIKKRNQLIRETRKQTRMTLKEIGVLFGGLSESMISKILKNID